ncbi:hypothetical protein [Streptomyces sp. NBC_00347]|uniref:hypothetical protein n=1 Tax=Streptomyces sp. NBC_00347 TaxID=2975721 RepID=UPI002251D469|nr:hypothetical protein [Streptomyces sp. NBC_00347]MCX5124615.1 hypothetical protein [Streptomyces sp. NBC_00347]
MLTVVQAATIAVALGFGTVGILTIVTGRVVIPWLRRSVRRPVVWGAGTLLMAGALAVAPVLPFAVFVPLLMAGVALVGFSQVARPRNGS